MTPLSRGNIADYAETREIMKRPMSLGNYLQRVMPRSVFTVCGVIKRLEVNYGHWNSIRRKSAVDNQGKPIAWYSYPALDYINQLDFSAKRVFEYGSGNSSLFWASISKSTASVEDNPAWFNKISGRAMPNLTIRLITDKDRYVNEIGNYEPFDVIVVDGSYRYACAGKAVSRLAAGGMIILDNSDLYIQTARLLREADLIQVDMTGFSPMVYYTTTTSFFLHRQFAFRPRAAHQPQRGVGGMMHILEDENAPT